MAIVEVVHETTMTGGALASQGRGCCVVRTVPGMAGGATLPVALDPDAEIVDGVLFAHRDRLFPALHHHRAGFPAPVRGVDHLVGRVLMALQAGLRHLLAGLERPFHQRRVVDGRGAARHAVPGAVGHLAGNRVGALCEVPDRDGNQRKDEDQAPNPAVLRVSHLRLKTAGFRWTLF